MTAAGELRERLTFQKRADLSADSPPGDGYGNVQGDWVDQFTTAAKVRPRFGTEAVMAARLEGRQPYEVTIRSSEAARVVTPEWRAVDARNAERIFNIRAAAERERRNFIDLLCEMGTAT